MLRIAMTLQAHSPGAYNKLKNELMLPDKRTIKRRIKKYQLEPGIIGAAAHIKEQVQVVTKEAREKNSYPPTNVCNTSNGSSQKTNFIV